MLFNIMNVFNLNWPEKQLLCRIRGQIIFNLPSPEMSGLVSVRLARSLATVENRRLSAAMVVARFAVGIEIAGIHTEGIVRTDETGD